MKIHTVPVCSADGRQPYSLTYLDRKAFPLATFSPAGGVINRLAQILSGSAGNPRMDCRGILAVPGDDLALSG